MPLSTLASTQPNQGLKLLMSMYLLMLSIGTAPPIPCSSRIGASPPPPPPPSPRVQQRPRRSSSRSGGPWHLRRRPRLEKHGPQRRPDLSGPRAIVRSLSSSNTGLLRKIQMMHSTSWRPPNSKFSQTSLMDLREMLIL
uniref:Uncharacterized protein n=1 Tax=Triticum urartu TaxID=4572 RepID=A0A8R7TE85_TRIUA